MSLRRAIPYLSKKVGGGGGSDYSNATLIYSLNKLNPSYSGDCCLVRRVSDSATQAISFDGSGLIDEAALNTFLGAGVGRLVTIYDQIGSNDGTAQSTGREPKIWDNGFILSSNGYPSVDFELSTLRTLTLTTEIDLISANGSYSTISGSNIVNATQCIFGHDSLNRQWRIGQNTTPNFSASTTGSPNDLALTTGIALVFGVNSSIEVYKSPNEARIYAQNQTNGLTAYSATSWKLNLIGSILNVIPYTGYFQEFMFFEDITTIDPATIRADRILKYS